MSLLKHIPTSPLSMSDVVSILATNPSYGRKHNWKNYLALKTVENLFGAPMNEEAVDKDAK
jgi:hypothetical protein